MKITDLILEFEELKNLVDTNNKKCDNIERQISDLDEKQNEKIKFTSNISSSIWKLLIDDLFFHHFDEAIETAFWYNDMANELIELFHSIAIDSKRKIDRMCIIVKELDNQIK